MKRVADWGAMGWYDTHACMSAHSHSDTQACMQQTDMHTRTNTHANTHARICCTQHHLTPQYTARCSYNPSTPLLVMARIAPVLPTLLPPAPPCPPSAPSSTALATSVASARVGRGVSVMVSTTREMMTGLPAMLHFHTATFCSRNT